MIRVAVVDDERLVRSGLRMILGTAPDIEMVADCGGAEAVETVLRCAADVVLLDIRMPDVDGLTVLRRLRAAPEPPAVAMLTTFDAQEYLTAALREGRPGSCSRTPIRNSSYGPYGRWRRAGACSTRGSPAP